MYIHRTWFLLIFVFFSVRSSETVSWGRRAKAPVDPINQAETDLTDVLPTITNVPIYIPKNYEPRKSLNFLDQPEMEDGDIVPQWLVPVHPQKVWRPGMEAVICAGFPNGHAEGSMRKQKPKKLWWNRKGKEEAEHDSKNAWRQNQFHLILERFDSLAPLKTTPFKALIIEWSDASSIASSVMTSITTQRDLNGTILPFDERTEQAAECLDFFLYPRKIVKKMDSVDRLVRVAQKSFTWPPIYYIRFRIPELIGFSSSPFALIHKYRPHMITTRLIFKNKADTLIAYRQGVDDIAEAQRILVRSISPETVKRLRVARLEQHPFMNHVIHHPWNQKLLKLKEKAEKWHSNKTDSYHSSARL